MSGDELAAAIFAKYGYFPIGSRCPREIGEIIRPTGGNISTPLKVVGPSSLSEFLMVSSDLMGIEAGDVPTAPDGYPFFYRVEAAD